MGMWSKTIINGDSALDRLDEISIVIGFEYPDTDNDDERDAYEAAFPFKEKLEKFEDAVGYALRGLDVSSNEYNCHIRYMSMGYLFMKYGAKISTKWKKMILDEAKNDSWAKVDEERNYYIQDFIQKLKMYDNQSPIDIETIGLFDAMMEHDGKGLLNQEISK